MPLPSVEIHTARLLLRAFQPSDRAFVFEGLSDPEVIQHYGVSYATLEATGEQMRWYDKIQQTGTGQWWAICRAGQPAQLMGACGLNDLDAEHRRAEIGYWLLPRYWGHGLATEAVSAMAQHAFQSMNLHRLGADVDMGNHASAALLRRLGFTREGIRRGYEMKNGQPIDLQLFSLLATDTADALSGILKT